MILIETSQDNIKWQNIILKPNLGGKLKRNVIS